MRPGLTVALLGIALATATGARASDPAFDRVSERAKACITANAADVERAEPSLTDAATFLLGDVCAVPVSIRERYRASALWLDRLRQNTFSGFDDEGDVADEKTAARMKAIMAKQRDAYVRATISEETGEMLMPPGATNQIGFAITAAGTGRDAASPDIRAFAAKALLDARKVRLAR